MRVLVVEDDRHLANNVKRGLERAGQAADVVHDGEAALAATATVDYDAILLDIMLPGADGIEVTRELRARRVSIPILMLTARDSVDDRVTGLDSGADDYVVKPFSIREVVARIKALTRRHLPDRSARLRSGESVVLDTMTRRLAIRGSEVDLTAKEFAVLEYFMLHEGVLLNRRQILQHVWDYDFEGGRNLIEVYINRLRAKFAGCGASDPFITVRGVGYRFEVVEC